MGAFEKIKQLLTPAALKRAVEERAKHAAVENVTAAVLASKLPADLQMAMLAPTAKVTPANVHARIGEVMQIRDLCHAADKPALAVTAAKTGLSIELVRAAAIAQRAEEDEAISIVTSYSEGKRMATAEEVYKRRGQ